MKSWPWLSAAPPVDARAVVSRISLGELTPRLTLRVAGSWAGPLLVVSREVVDACNWPTCGGGCRRTEITDAWPIPAVSSELELVHWVLGIVKACLNHEVDEWATFDGKRVVGVNHG